MKALEIIFVDCIEMGITHDRVESERRRASMKIAMPADNVQQGLQICAVLKAVQTVVTRPIHANSSGEQTLPRLTARHANGAPVIGFNHQ